MLKVQRSNHLIVLIDDRIGSQISALPFMKCFVSPPVCPNYHGTRPVHNHSDIIFQTVLAKGKQNGVSKHFNFKARTEKWCLWGDDVVMFLFIIMDSMCSHSGWKIKTKTHTNQFISFDGDDLSSSLWTVTSRVRVNSDRKIAKYLTTFIYRLIKKNTVIILSADTK